MSQASEIISEHFIRQLFALAGEISPLEFNSKKVGLPGPLLYKMQKLSMRQVMLLAARHAKSILKVEINVDQLELLVSSIDYIDEEMSLAVEFLQKEASLPLMEKMFGYTPHDVRVLRDAIGTTQNGGRPKCDVLERDDIMVSWKKHSDTPERERYLLVAEETGLSLKVIHMVICQEQIRVSADKTSQQPLNICAHA